MELGRIDTRHFLHPFTALQEHEQTGPQIYDRAEGVYLYDRSGKRYIDGMAGLWCVNVGYGRRELAEVMARQVEKLSYYHSFMSAAHEPVIQLSGKLAALTPAGLNRAFFCNSGSEANDTLIKIIWYYNNLRGKPEKKKLIARRGAYHGVTIATGSLSGLSNLQNGFDLPRERFLHVSRPHAYWEKPDGLSPREYSLRLAQELEDTILREGPDTVAAFFVEPIMGAGGVIPPPEGYFEAVAPVLKRHDVLFAVDEVICGFGRLGTMFGSETFGLAPDLMTLAKGLTSGYIPMSACMVSDAVYDVLRTGTPTMGPFAHGFTYTGHPVAAATALKNIEIIEREGLVDNAKDCGAYFQARLRDAVADHPLVGEVRGLGLIAGVELVADKAAKRPFDLSEGVARKLHRHALALGLVCRPIFNTIAFAPPLIISREQVDAVVDRFASALRNLAKDLGR